MEAALVHRSHASKASYSLHDHPPLKPLPYHIPSTWRSEMIYISPRVQRWWPYSTKDASLQAFPCGLQMSNGNNTSGNSQLQTGQSLSQNSCLTLLLCTKHLVLMRTGITSSKPATQSAGEALAKRWMDGWLDRWKDQKAARTNLIYYTSYFAAFVRAKRTPTASHINSIDALPATIDSLISTVPITL